MSFYKFLFNYAKQYAFPAFKSFFKAYKDVTGGAKNTGNSGQKQHFFDSFLSSFASKTNLSAPLLTQSTAMQILNIDKNIEQVEPKQILQRYYTLFKKNDPSIGGTAYIQSKIYASKECLMARFPNAAELEHEFYKEVIEPEQKKQKQQAGEGQQKEKSENEKK